MHTILTSKRNTEWKWNPLYVFRNFSRRVRFPWNWNTWYYPLRHQPPYCFLFAHSFYERQKTSTRDQRLVSNLKFVLWGKWSKCRDFLWEKSQLTMLAPSSTESKINRRLRCDPIASAFYNFPAMPVSMRWFLSTKHRGFIHSFIHS